MRNELCDSANRGARGTLAPAGRIGQTVLRRLRDLGSLLAAWHRRARQRRELGELDDRTLRDIGASRADADFEARKRFWQP